MSCSQLNTSRKRTCPQSGHWGSGCGRGREGHREEKRCGHARTGARLHEKKIGWSDEDRTEETKILTSVAAVVVVVISHDDSRWEGWMEKEGGRKEISKLIRAGASLRKGTTHPRASTRARKGKIGFESFCEQIVQEEKKLGNSKMGARRETKSLPGGLSKTVRQQTQGTQAAMQQRRTTRYDENGKVHCTCIN